MNDLFKFSTIALLLLMLIGLMLFFFIGHGVYSGKGATLKFVNSSGQQVESAQISVAGQSCSVKQLGAGGEMVCSFQNLYDSSYSAAVTLQDGSVYATPSLGYVTGGMNFNDIITINQSGVFEFVSRPRT